MDQPTKCIFSSYSWWSMVRLVKVYRLFWKLRQNTNPDVHKSTPTIWWEGLWG